MPLEGRCKDEEDGFPEDDGAGEVTEMDDDEDAAERLRVRDSGRSSGWRELPSPREEEEGKTVATEVSMNGRCISNYIDLCPREKTLLCKVERSRRKLLRY